jgi:hypothetical protein
MNTKRSKGKTGRTYFQHRVDLTSKAKDAVLRIARGIREEEDIDHLLTRSS